MSRVSGDFETEVVARAAPRPTSSFTATSIPWGFAAFTAELCGIKTSALVAGPQPTFCRFLPQCCRGASKRVSAEFCAKPGSELWTRTAKNRIRDNASLSAPNDAGADHGRRCYRVRRFAKGFTSFSAAGRTGARLRACRCKSLLREACAGWVCSKPREQLRLSRRRSRVRLLISRLGCSGCNTNLVIGSAV